MTAMRNSNAKHIDFGFLQGAFPNPRELPVNVDMMMEKNNYFLVGEWKKPNEKISRGQEIMLQRLAKIKNIKVLIITGNSDDEDCYVDKVEQMHDDGTREELGKGLTFFTNLVQAWHTLAIQRKL